MERILVTGAYGQIGSELIPALRDRFGVDNVIAAGFGNSPPAQFLDGPNTFVDVTDYGQVDAAIREHSVDTVYHLGSILSAMAEQDRKQAYAVNFTGVHHVLEAALANDVRQVIVPSSIAAFGPETPAHNTPNDTVQKPNTIYGISKVFTELMGNYYTTKLGLDVRGVRLPGIISWKVEPTAGTTDYAVAIFYGAIREGRYASFLGPDTRLPMMYIPDAVSSLIDVATADFDRIKHHVDYNVSAMSFTPAELATAIERRIPGFEMRYDVDPLRQSIADSWPDELDDTVARHEWDWSPDYDLDTMVDDMLANLRRKLA